MDIRIGRYTVGPSHPPVVIAEMSGNHNQSLDQALAIVDAAADAKVHALKLQTFTPDTITFNSRESAFMIDEANPLWQGQNLYDLYAKAYTPWEWHRPIFDRAAARGLMVFSSPFDESAVDFLESLGVPCYKIASFENNHIPLLRKVAATGKPVIMSTGVASIGDIEEAVTTLRNAGCGQLVLLKCTSTYPATPEGSNVRTIPNLQAVFNCTVGLSDHTLGVGAAVAAVALGARVIEKHFTISRAAGGVDAAFSLEPHEMALLVEETARAFAALGEVSYTLSPGERSNQRYKRSIFAVADIESGEPFTKDNIRVIRPGTGLHPRHYAELLSKRAARPLRAGTPLGIHDL